MEKYLTPYWARKSNIDIYLFILLLTFTFNFAFFLKAIVGAIVMGILSIICLIVVIKRHQRKNTYIRLRERAHTSGQLVRGQIVEVEARLFLLGFEQKPEKLKKNDYGYCYRYEDIGYRFIVTYMDPFFNVEKQALSEIYAWYTLYQYARGRLGQSGKSWFKPTYNEEFVDLYLLDNGEAVVEVIPV